MNSRFVESKNPLLMNFPDFQLIQDALVPSLQAKAWRFRHRSGLEVFCLENSDRENLFALQFSTPPNDNTGVPHILEHTVLSGSQKFALRDPFIELIKSSLATFINAMTFADCTVYPVCSCHEKDFFNLSEVYWDAVFHPLLSPYSFQQEGWHYELGKNRKGEPRLRINGIVLNEMSGAYAEMETVLERSVYKYLFPDSPLAFDSGGHPEEIPQLTYQRFLDYYHTHYRYDKAKIIFAGNIPLEKKLAFLQRQLQGVPDAVAPMPEARLHYQSRKWRFPRQKSVSYVPEPDDDEKTAALVLAWRIDSRRNPELDLAMQLLDLILLGNAGAPLPKALLESGLCSALTSSGYDDNYCQTLFQIGVRGCRPENFPAIEQLIFDCLREQSREIAENKILAAKRQLKLDHAEIGSEYNLDILEDVLAAWNYNYDPLLFLNQEKTWRKLEKKLAGNTAFLENLLKKYFLDNPQYLRLWLLPDSSLLARQEKRSAARLQQLQDTMTSEQLQQILLDQKTLRKMQRKADSPAALRALPRLKKEDLAAIPPRLPFSECFLSNHLPLLIGEVFTNQVSYLNVAFALNQLPEHLQTVLPFFAAFFNQVGTNTLPYDVIATHQAEAATSIRASLEACPYANGKDGLQILLCFSLQTLENCLPEALRLLQHQLTCKAFREKKRISEILLQHWAHIMSELQSNGQGFAALRGANGLTPAASLMDEWQGLPHVQQAKIWREFTPVDFQKQLDLLNELAAWLAIQTPLIASCAGGDSALQNIRQFLEQFPTSPKRQNSDRTGLPPVQYGRNELFPVNTDVSSYARVISAPHRISNDSAALEIYAKLLSCGYLWQEVRLKNGAYGVHCRYSPFSRTLTLQSSDDPNPAKTRNIFAGLPEAAAAQSWSDDDIRDAVIACSRNDESPWRPARIVNIAMYNKIIGFSEEMRTQRRRALLAQTPDSIRQAVTRFWRDFSAQKNDCLLGSVELAKKMKLTTFQI